MTHPKTSELMARLRFRAQVMEAQARRAVEDSLSPMGETSPVPPARPAWYDASKVKPFVVPVKVKSVRIKDAGYGLTDRNKKRKDKTE